MAAHILMTSATRRPYRDGPPLRPLLRYDPAKGYWLKGNTPLVVTEEFLAGDYGTKKADQETGEDQKGE